MIVVFGSINLDLIFPLPRLPALGETVLTPAVRIEPGGKGANQAVAAARDEAKVVFAGAVGQDALASGALVTLQQAGVDLTRVGAHRDETTGCAAIFVDQAGRNVIGVGSGANLAARAAQVEDALLAPGTTLLLQMETSPEESAALIRRARSRGARVVLNLAPAREIGSDALRMLNLLVLNENEADWLADHIGADATSAGLRAALGINAVVRTLGERGAEAATPDTLVTIPAHLVTPVDTTGAGDCFTGVLAAGLDRGVALEPVLRRANAAAAICCTRPGTQGSMPTAAEIDAALDRSRA